MLHLHVLSISLSLSYLYQYVHILSHSHFQDLPQIHCPQKCALSMMMPLSKRDAYELWHNEAEALISYTAGSILPFWGDLVLLDPNSIRRKQFDLYQQWEVEPGTPNWSSKRSRSASWLLQINHRKYGWCLVKKSATKRSDSNNLCQKHGLAWTQVVS